MIKKDIEIKKTVWLVEREDIERVATAFFGKEVKIGDIDFYFDEDVDLSARKSQIGFGISIDDSMEMLNIELKDGNPFAMDLGFDEIGYFSGLGTFPSDSEVFAFDTGEFASYHHWTEFTKFESGDYLDDDEFDDEFE